MENAKCPFGPRRKVGRDVLREVVRGRAPQAVADRVRTRAGPLWIYHDNALEGVVPVSRASKPPSTRRSSPDRDADSDADQESEGASRVERAVERWHEKKRKWRNLITLDVEGQSTTS
jgi:hypothetical protein